MDGQLTQFSTSILVLSDNKIHYQLMWPLTNEVFQFDENGYHMSTSAMLTDSELYSFFYDENKRLRRVMNKRRSAIDINYTDGPERAAAEILINGILRYKLQADKNGKLSTVLGKGGHETK